MSDYADTADNKIYQTIAVGLAAARCAPTLMPDCRCHFCDEVIAPEVLFCNVDCRDDFEKEEAAFRREGH